MPGEHRTTTSYYQPGTSQQTSSISQLDDFVIMEKEHQQGPTSPPPDGSSLQDVYAQLVQKERDLLLAAQLGKALLEKNEELGLQNEKMAEDYSRQLEVSPYPPRFIGDATAIGRRLLGFASHCTANGRSPSECDDEARAA